MARGSLALQMPKPWAGPLGLWQTVFCSCLITHIWASETPDLRCHTDFYSEVVCQWDGKDAVNCATEFQLEVRTDANRLKCVPENRRLPASATLSCFCIIHETSFSGTKYTFSLVTGTNRSKEQTFSLSDIVKPRMFRNLTVIKSKRRSFILTWEKGYDSSHLFNRQVSFSQVQISSEGQTQPELKNVTEQGQRYEIFGLSPGKNYTARVRYQIANWGGFWSDWSSPCTWSNDFELEPEDNRWWLILLTCFLIVVLVSACYFCLARLKREWWDQVPSPAKSKVAEDLGEKRCLAVWPMFQGDQGKVPFCASSQNLFKRPLSFMDSPPQNGATFPGRLDQVSRPREKWEAVLTPEVPSLELSLEVCSPVPRPGHGAWLEDEEDHAPCNDVVADLFLDILGGWDSVKDAETTPKTGLEEPSPAMAPELVLRELCLYGRTPRKSPGGSSKSDYQNSDVATSPRAASPAPEQHQGGGQSFSALQYKLLLFPQQLPGAPYRTVVTDRISPQGSSGSLTPLPSGYKSLSSLLGLPTASLHQPRKHEPDFPGVDPAEPLGSWPPSCGEGPLIPPQQEAPPQNTLNTPCALQSCLSGYRPFRSAPQDPSCLGSGSPYKPLLGLFEGVPKEGPLDPLLRMQEAEREVWQGAPWEEPPTFSFCQGLEDEEEDAGQGGVLQGVEGFPPQVPIATL